MHPFMYRLLCSVCFAPDPTPGASLKPGDPGYIAPIIPDDDDPDDTPPGLSPEAIKEFEKIRRRNARYRTERNETNKKLEDEIANRDKAIKDAVTGVTTTIKADADKRVIGSEVRAALKAAGVVDVGDAMKLLDLSKLTVGENGEVAGVDDLISAAKMAKAYLFAEVTTSHGGKPPTPGGTKPKHVKDMTDAEADAELARLTKVGNR